MICRRITNCEPIVEKWIAELPSAIRSKMDALDFSNKLNFLITGDNQNPVMVVTAEEKTTGVYDVHMFCARRINRQSLFEGMAAVKKAFFAIESLHTLVFTVLSRQTVLKKTLAMNGCVWTGWKFLEDDRTFEHWVLQKPLQAE